MRDNELLAVSMPAWILKLNADFKIALDESSMAEYIRGPQVYSVPDAVDYCNQIFVWRGDFVPVIDVSLIFAEEALDTQHIAVVSYQEYAGQQPKYVGIKVSGEVQRVIVTDDTACDWSEDYPLQMQPIVESLFMYEEKLVSVIKIADLCNDGYRDYVAQLAEIQSSL